MSSQLGGKRLWPLFAVVALEVMGCGGKGSSEKRNLTAAGQGGASSSTTGEAGGAAPDPKDEPSMVQVGGSDGEIDPQATPECMYGFQGFWARVGGMSIEFHAFVSEPGDYAGDSVHILWLEVRRADGEHYLATGGTAVESGNVSLHVAQVAPRFIGSLEASLAFVDDPMRAPLMLDLTFDIAARAGCP